MRSLSQSARAAVCIPSPHASALCRILHIWGPMRNYFTACKVLYCLQSTSKYFPTTVNSVPTIEVPEEGFDATTNLSKTTERKQYKQKCTCAPVHLTKQHAVESAFCIVPTRPAPLHCTTVQTTHRCSCVLWRCYGTRQPALLDFPHSCDRM